MNLPEFALYAFPGPSYEVGKTEWIEENLTNIPSYYAMDNVRLRWPMQQKIVQCFGTVLLLNGNLNLLTLALYFVNLSLSFPYSQINEKYYRVFETTSTNGA